MRQFVYCMLASAVWIAAAAFATAQESGDLQQPASVLPGHARQAFVESAGTANQVRRATRVSDQSNAAPALVNQRGAGRAAQQRVPVNMHQASFSHPGQAGQGAPIPAYQPGAGGGAAPVRYDSPHMPNYAWPSYAPYPNYGAVTYPRQYSPSAWPYIGPFYPYPQVPLGWRKVSLEWDDGWWMLDFKQR
jgi:hypothetical protein